MPRASQAHNAPPGTHSRRRAIQLGLAGLLGLSVAALQQAMRRPGFDPHAPPPTAIAALPTAVVAPQPIALGGAAASTPLPAPASPPIGSHPIPITSAPHLEPTDVPPPVVIHIPAPKPPIIAHADWGAMKPAGPFVPQQPHRITLHHEGVPFDSSMSAPDYLRHVQDWCINHRKWPDIPYHFLIDLEGNIYEGRPLSARGDTNTSYDPQDHALVALLGKYDAGEQQPNQMQIDSIIALMAWIADTYEISPDLIHGHRDFIPLNDKGEPIDPRTGEKITCPGDNLYRYLADGTIQNGIARVLARARVLRRHDMN